ncbi:hypothetical protein BV22DRAFT_1026932, partial [Leucogyrophana mollusca]
LASLARTCRTFRDPALDVLWSFLKSFDPLIRCLPQDLWEMDDDYFLVLFVLIIFRYLPDLFPPQTGSYFSNTPNVFASSANIPNPHYLSTLVITPSALSADFYPTVAVSYRTSDN